MTRGAFLLCCLLVGIGMGAGLAALHNADMDKISVQQSTKKKVHKPAPPPPPVTDEQESEYADLPAVTPEPWMVPRGDSLPCNFNDGTSTREIAVEAQKWEEYLGSAKAIQAAAYLVKLAPKTGCK